MPPFAKQAGRFALPQVCVSGPLALPPRQPSILAVFMFTKLVGGFTLPFVDHDGVKHLFRYLLAIMFLSAHSASSNLSLTFLSGFFVFFTLSCMSYLFCTLFPVRDLSFHSLLMFSFGDHNSEAVEHHKLFFLNYWICVLFKETFLTTKSVRWFRILNSKHHKICL